MSFTYDQLKQAIQDYTENSETSFVANLPLFIRAAEERILKNVQLDLFRRNQTAALTQANPYLNCPSDFLAPFSLSYTLNNEKTFVEFKDVSFVQTYSPNATTQGLPKYYARFDQTNFMIAPTPDSNYTIELHYYFRPDSLTAGADSGTTWISTNAPFALLYGSLVEAYFYMKGEADVLAQYEKNFAFYMERLKDLGEARENTDANRVGLPARPRT